MSSIERLGAREPASGSQRSASSTKARAERGRSLVRVGADLLCGQVAMPERNRDAERAALADDAVDRRTEPPCSRDQLLHQREADARALVGAARGPATRWKRSKSFGSSSAGMPVPVSRTVSSKCDAGSRSLTSISPSKVNLKALETRLRTIFSHISRSTKTGSRERRAVDDELQPGLLDRRAEHARELRGEGRKVGRLVGRLDAAGLDAREIEQRVDELSSRRPLRWTSSSCCVSASPAKSGLSSR